MLLHHQPGLGYEQMFDYGDGVQRDDLDQAWKVENLRRSLAMLPPGSPGLPRDDAMLVLELLMELMAERPT
jgi:hypothetical protein